MKYIVMFSVILCISMSLIFPGKSSSDDGYIVPQKIVEFDGRYFYGLDGYYSVREKIERDRIQDLLEENAKIRAQLDVLMELVKKMQAGVAGQNPPNIPPVENPNNPEQPVDPVVPDQNPEENPNNGVSSLEEKVYNILVDACGDCHGKANDRRLQLVDIEQGQLFNYGAAQIADIVQRTERIHLEDKKAMPPGGTALSDEDVLTLKLWLYAVSDVEIANNKEN